MNSYSEKDPPSVGDTVYLCGKECVVIKTLTPYPPAPPAIEIGFWNGAGKWDTEFISGDRIKILKYDIRPDETNTD